MPDVSVHVGLGELPSASMTFEHDQQPMSVEFRLREAGDYEVKISALGNFGTGFIDAATVRAFHGALISMLGEKGWAVHRGK